LSVATAQRPLWTPPRRPTRFDVLGIGENSLDTVCVLDRLPQPGEHTAARRILTSPGGQVATAVLACARLGLRCSYAGRVGDDASAAAILEPLRKAGVDLGGVLRTPGTASRTAVILVDAASGERTVLGHRDPSLALSPADLEPELLGAAKILHLDAVDLDAAIAAAQRARESGAAVVLDADTPSPGIEALLAVVDFPIVSRAFAEEFGGSGSLRDGLEAVSGPLTRLAVATLGAKGAVSLGPDGWLETPAFEVVARDTTGAGDAFHAGFIWGLLQGFDTSGVLRTAHAVAALNCTAVGAQAGLPGPEELARFVDERGP